MYPYDYNNRNDSTPETGGSLHRSPLLQQYTAPDEITAPRYEPVRQPDYHDRIGAEQRKKSKAPRYIAAAAALIIASSAAGGGTAMYILRNYAPTAPAASDTAETTLKSAEISGSSPIEAGSVAFVADTASDSVVEIDVKTEMQNSFFFGGTTLVPGSGSGVVISEDGYIVTNNHVVEGVDSILVRLRDGTEYEATLIGTDAQSDLAVIKIEAEELQPVTFADSDSIKVGDMAVAIGNPLGELGGTVTSGIISATGREVTIDGDEMTLLQTSAAINPGNSGGGLFDSNGRLIGVVNAKSAGVEIEGLGFAIPANTVKKVAADIIDKGYVSGRPAMGIQIVEVNDQRTAIMYGVTKAGVYVADPGDNEGLKQGDRFVFIDGRSIESSGDVSSALREHNVGDAISVTVERDGRAVETEVTLKEKLPEQSASGEEPDKDEDERLPESDGQNRFRLPGEQ